MTLPGQFDQLTAIKAMFVFYALLGVGGCLLYARVQTQPPPAQGEPAATLANSAANVDVSRHTFG